MHCAYGPLLRTYKAAAVVHTSRLCAFKRGRGHFREGGCIVRVQHVIKQLFRALNRGKMSERTHITHTQIN